MQPLADGVPVSSAIASRIARRALGISCVRRSLLLRVRRVARRRSVRARGITLRDAAKIAKAIGERVPIEESSLEVIQS